MTHRIVHLLIAPALLGLLGAACGDDDGASGAGAVDLDQRLDELLVAPDGTSLVEVEADFSGLFAEVNESADTRFDARQIVDADDPDDVLGALLVQVFDADDPDAAEGGEDFIEGLSSRGDPEPLQVGSLDAVILEAQGLSLVAWPGPDYAVVVGGISEQEAIDMAESYAEVAGGAL